MGKNVRQFSGLDVLGRKMRQRRIERDMAIRTLSHLTGLSPSTLYALENGQGNPTLGSLIDVCETLGFKLGLSLVEKDKTNSEA